MKYRKDFVTNSSSSSFICEICGANESGWDISLSEAGMVECVNGHTFCESEMADVDKEQIVKVMLEPEYNNHSESELKEMKEDYLKSELLDIDDMRYEIPELFCPICQFVEYSEKDLSAYLLKKYNVSRDLVFAEVKKTNKRRKKLYENEYITYVCQQFDLNPAKIVSGWRSEYESYSDFKKSIR